MAIDRIFSVFNTAASGLSAQRRQMEVTAKNIANVETLETPEGGPYRKRGVNFSAKDSTWFSRILQREASRFGPLGERMLFGDKSKTSGVICVSALASLFTIKYLYFFGIRPGVDYLFLVQILLSFGSNCLLGYLFVTRGLIYSMALKFLFGLKYVVVLGATGS